ncbi:MAG: hypothetical protein JWN86_3615 [Planctomycetota bacterium]|nr:hypothetical protein [Planctomycetota bacterium]
MADPVAIAIKQEAATTALNETLRSLDDRLARIEVKLDGGLASPDHLATLDAGPDIVTELKAAKEEILAAFVARGKAVGPVAPAGPAPAAATPAVAAPSPPAAAAVPDPATPRGK